jgi:pyruvate ferredoxin oxidoreductase beta subunit
METPTIYAPLLTSKDENFAPGHRACVGCGEALAIRQVFKAFDRNTIVVNSTGCSEIVASQYPFTSWRIPWIHTLFENASAVVSGIDAGLKVMNRKGTYTNRPKLVAQGGDGATADIGLQALSGAMERGHDFTYVCYDNEAYMNTGIQRSSATPFGASTTTSPAGKVSFGQSTQKKNMPAIAVAHNIPYVATACPSYPFDLMAKVKKAMAVEGPAYLHVFAVCPTGWRCAGDLTVRYGRLAVEAGVFPLYEVEGGKYKMTVEVPKLRPIRDYLKGQGRFRHLTEDMIDDIQKQVTKDYQTIKKLTGSSRRAR